MIALHQVSKIYKGSDVKAVDNISFELQKGKVGCLIGTSGCGKTTTLKMVNRLEEPSEGYIEVNGKKSHEIELVEWRRQIGYVVQKAGLLPHLTVEKNISILSKILKRDKKSIQKRVEELMELIELPYSEFSKRYPKELSGGQQQRVGIARALMEDPQVLLMDEPFGALDPITRKTLHEEVMRLNTILGKTILIVTHDMEEAFKLGDQVLLMDKGKLLQAGDKASFTQNPKNDFVKDFLKDHLEAS